MVDNSLAKARGLSLRTGGQNVLYLSLVQGRACGCHAALSTKSCETNIIYEEISCGTKDCSTPFSSWLRINPVIQKVQENIYDLHSDEVRRSFIMTAQRHLALAAMIITLKLKEGHLKEMKMEHLFHII